MKIVLIFAATTEGGIGFRNKLPFKLPDDLRHFKKETKGHFLLCGRKTFESLGRPLPDRNHIVLSGSQKDPVDNVQFVDSLEKGIQAAKEQGAEKLFIIGGAKVLEKALPFADEIIYTRVEGNPECDVFLSRNFLEALEKMNKETVLTVSREQFPHNEYSFTIYRLLPTR